MMQKVNRGIEMLISFSLNKSRTAKGLRLFTQTLRSQPFVFYGWWWMCTVLCVRLLVSVVVCGSIFQQMKHTIHMHATLRPPSVHLCLLPSLTQSLSSLFLSSTKHQFTVLPIKAHIHAANYQWHDSFGLVPVPLISPLPFSISLEGPLKARLPVNVTNTVLGLTRDPCL